LRVDEDFFNEDWRSDFYSLSRASFLCVHGRGAAVYIDPTEPLTAARH